MTCHLPRLQSITTNSWKPRAPVTAFTPLWPREPPDAEGPRCRVRCQACPTSRSRRSRRRHSATSQLSSSGTRACSPAAGARTSIPTARRRVRAPRGPGAQATSGGRRDRARGTGLRRRPRCRLGGVRIVRGTAHDPSPQGVPRHCRATARLQGHLHPGRAHAPRPGPGGGRPARRRRADRAGRRRPGRGLPSRHRRGPEEELVVPRQRHPPDWALDRSV